MSSIVDIETSQAPPHRTLHAVKDDVGDMHLLGFPNAGDAENCKNCYDCLCRCYDRVSLLLYIFPFEPTRCYDFEDDVPIAYVCFAQQLRWCAATICVLEIVRVG